MEHLQRAPKHAVTLGAGLTDHHGTSLAGILIVHIAVTTMTTFVLLLRAQISDSDGATKIVILIEVNFHLFVRQTN